jgi:DNA repair exonuclease SbcCD ATPase subunit
VEIDELYSAPYDEFIARRDALAKSLRKDGRRDEADQVKKLPKPALSAWALNQLPRDAVDELIGAGAALRQARGGDTLRDATRDERAAVEDLASQATALVRQAGHPVTEKTAGEIRDTLHAAALDEEAREALASGRLDAPRRAVGVFGGAASAGTPAPTRARGRARAQEKTQTQTQTKAKTKKDDAAARKRERERQAAARAAVRDAEKQVREREREVAAAQRALERAQADLEKARGSLPK